VTDEGTTSELGKARRNGGWLMEAKRGDGSKAAVFVDPKTQTIVDADFR
jgi:hypothetical protein